MNKHYDLIRKTIEENPGLTTKELAHYLRERGFKIEESTVVGQVSFLKDDRLVVSVGMRKCSRTGHNANVLEAVNVSNQHLLPPLETLQDKRNKKAQNLFLQIMQDENSSMEVKLKLLTRLQAKILIYGEPKWADLFEEDL